MSKKKEESQTTSQSVSKSLGMFATGGEQGITVGTEIVFGQFHFI